MFINQFKELFANFCLHRFTKGGVIINAISFSLSVCVIKLSVGYTILKIIFI